MHIPEEKKVDILVSGLEERYSAMRAIRERIQSVCIWALGLLLAAGGWLLQSDTTLEPRERIVCIIGLLVGFLVLRFKFLEDLQKGFRSQQRAAAAIEESLGMYEVGAFSKDSSIYPPEWKKAGSDEGEGKFFESTYWLLYLGVGFLLVALLINGCDVHVMPEHHHWIRTYWTLPR
jgi:hypothetical protein